MEFNICKTCGAKDGSAGLLLNDECLNCYDTRKTGNSCIHSHLVRTEGELGKTFGILNIDAAPQKTV